MKLLRLLIENVRGVPDGAYAFTAPQSGAPLAVALVTGPQGSGKTSLLEAIAAAKDAVGSYGAPADPRRLLRHGVKRGRIEATWQLSEEERVRAGLDEAEHTVTWEFGEEPSRPDAEPRLRRLFGSYTRAPDRGKVEYFPAGRRLASLAPRPLEPPLTEEREGRLRLTRDPDKYASLLAVLPDVALRDAARLAELVSTRGVALRKDLGDVLAPFRLAIAAMLPDVRLAAVDVAPPGAVHFVRRDGVRLDFDDLSEGERQGVLFALAFRHLGLNHSLVLIDEPELHVHAVDRVRFLQGLVGLGVNNQIIAATGSVEILSAALRGQVIELQGRTREAAS